MGLMNEYTEIKGNGRNLKYYTSKGYDIKNGDFIKVKTVDISPGSTVKITVSCDICGDVKDISWSWYYTSFNNHGYYSCKKCKSIKTKKTNLKKYGSTSPMGNKDILLKAQQTNLKKYGNVCSLHGDIVKLKVEETFNEKWGGDIGSHMKDLRITNKIKETNIDKYGVEYPTQNDEIKNKIINTNLRKYGVKNVGMVEEFKDKIKKTQFDNYGNWYFITNKEYLSKLISDKYGSSIYTNSDEFLDKKNEEMVKKFDTIDNYSFIEYSTPSVYKISSNICDHIFDINNDNFHNRLKKIHNICTVCNPIGDTSSLMEISIREFLDELDIDYITTDKTLIKPKHLDIYIPYHNLAIEFNGMYWHSEKFKSNDYHLNKTINCNIEGVELLHIFEDDWKYKKDIIKSIIRNKLNKTPNKIYARNCDIRIVNIKDTKNFLNKNHIQGFSKSKHKIGLYFENELVSLMTFGYRKTNTKKEYELIRFCNKLNTNVIGGSSKLFKNFITNYNIDESYIISYADISLFNGDMYRKLGFSYIHLSKPNYFWIINGKRQHRWKYNKQKLIKEGFDPNQTEVEIMHNRGYYRIFSCGQKRYEYTIN